MPKIKVLKSINMLGIEQGCGAPNLDGYFVDDLMTFWNESHRKDLASYLFPNKPRGYVQVTKDLGNYASNKATAMQCRERGDINIAMMYERICDSIYNKLPKWAKW